MLFKEKARATNHVGIKGKGSSRHNFREFPKITKEEGISKIDRSLTFKNQYFILGKFCDNKDLQDIYRANAEEFRKQAFKFREDARYTDLTNSQKVELAIYDNILKDNLKEQHKRNASRRQTCLDKNAIDVLLSTKTRPEESILQIGNKDYCPVSAEQLWSIYQDYVQEHNARFGKHIQILNAVLHADEPTGTVHVHERKAYIGVNRYGETCIGKDSALAQLDIERPDLTKITSRRNNRKQTYTAECRQMWLDICKKHGLKLETEPRVYEDKHGLELIEYKVRQEHKKLDKVMQEVTDQKQIIFTNTKIINEQNNRIKDYEYNWNDVDIAIYISNTVKAEYPDYHTEIINSYLQEKQVEINYLEL